jgi:adenine-specific DNA-methyltransferase
VVSIRQRTSQAALGELLALAEALGARDVGPLTVAEESLLRSRIVRLPLFTAPTREAIERGEDPLGEAFCQVYSNDERRPLGATYTPLPIVEAIVNWAARHSEPVRVVDPGSGSARFLVAIGRRFAKAELVAVEKDPAAAILARGHLAAAGLADRSRVEVCDYRELRLPAVDGQTLFIGNPPYVRHHDIEPHWKQWLTETARRHGYSASQLSGLHVHFFLATLEHARPGDAGMFITAAEWIDVNYGRLVRELLLNGLGVKTIQVIEPAVEPFPGTQATAVITGFEVGKLPDVIHLQRVGSMDRLGDIDGARTVTRGCLKNSARWSELTRTQSERREGFVPLGELCRVHRGQVTGANRIWVVDRRDVQLPESVLFPTVTRAKELFASGGVLDDVTMLRRVVDLPVDLDLLTCAEREMVDHFLVEARARGAEGGFIALHRKSWWAVGLRPAAPILATYMARRPPAFVRNLAGARHINIAHGLYPKIDLSAENIDVLARFLSSSVKLDEGRAYAGGLTKFEPREMERLLVPRPELLVEGGSF